MDAETFPHTYGLARKFNHKTSRKEFCIAVMVDGYPDIAIHWFGPERPDSQDVVEKLKDAPMLERKVRNDFVLGQFPHSGNRALRKRRKKEDQCSTQR
jgi:hypothetical protein